MSDSDIRIESPARDANVSNTQDVYLRLREMLLNGEIVPGTVISQVTLARELGVSTTPLREAMRLLQAEGLLIAEHNRRMRVAPLDPRDIDAVYASRILIEALAIRLTVPTFTPADIAGLRADLDAMAQAAEAEDIRRGSRCIGVSTSADQRLRRGARSHHRSGRRSHRALPADEPVRLSRPHMGDRQR